MSKTLRDDTKLAEAHKLIMDYLATAENQASMYGTLLVCATKLGEFILKYNKKDSLPLEIMYYLSLTWNAYAAIYDTQRIIGVVLDPDLQDYFESGGVDDKFAMVVKQMYELCKEKKLL